MRFFSAVLLALCIASTLCSVPICYGYNPYDLIQSGIVIFEKNTDTTCHEIDIQYKVPSTGFEVAVSTSDLYGYKPYSGLDYSVRAGPKENNSKVLSLTLIVEDNSWKKIAVSYLASSNPALYLGSFIVDAYSLFGCDGNKFDIGAVTHYVEVSKKYAAHEIAVFISGVKTNDSSIFLDIRNTKYDSKTSLIEFDLKASSKPSIENVHISYVIWEKSSITVDLFNPEKGSKADYQLIGVEKFVKSIPEYLGLGIDFDRLLCVGSRCKEDCVSTEECKKWKGIIKDDICFMCGRYEKIYGDTCVPDCKENEVFIDGKCECEDGYIRFGDKCRYKCGINEIWKGGKCVCKDGHAKIDGVCRQCPPYSRVAPDQSSCICDKYYYWVPKTRTCEKIVCPPYSTLVYKGNDYECICDKGYIKFGDKCTYKCGVNEIWEGGKCICEKWFAKIDGVCQKCPPNSKVAKDGESCICDKDYYWNSITKKCDYLVCPPYSKVVWNKGYDCECDEGYVKKGKKCVDACGPYQVWKWDKCVCQDGYVEMDGVCKSCPPYSKPSSDGKSCICKTDYYWNAPTWKCDYLVCGDGAQVVYKKGQYICECADGYEYHYGKCEAPIRCPPRSIWNQKRLRCDCTKSGEYLIENECKSCGVYEGWNGKECVCQSGYYKIKGVCKTCDPNTYYNGRDCVCNHGWFGNADLCKRCHPTCGKCQGPQDNQCLTCSDVSYDLVDGKCTRNIPCPTGLYHDGKQCKPCSAYCSQCKSESLCERCIEGFNVEKLEYFGQKAAFCSEICGDGRRFEVDCDDGNTKSGDGCSDTCEVEKGYTCQGGSSIKPSHCVDFAPSRTFITLKGTVHLYGRIVQGIRMSYIPPGLTDNECAKCSKLLWVRVIDSQVVPGVRVKYLPGSKYQFLVEFEFHGLFAVPVFSISIQINPDFKDSFADADMAQIKIKTIDPAVLAKSDKHKELSFDDITSDPSDIDIADEDVDNIFS